MTLRLWCPVNTSITWRDGIRCRPRVTPVSRTACLISVPVSQPLSFHPDNHCCCINPASTNNILRNEGEIECTQSQASVEKLEAPLPRTFWHRGSKFARSFGMPRRQRVGGTAEQRLLLQTSTIRTHWHPHLQERMAYFSWSRQTLRRHPAFRKRARLWRLIMRLSQRLFRRKRYTSPRLGLNRVAGWDLSPVRISSNKRSEICLLPTRS